MACHRSAQKSALVIGGGERVVVQKPKHPVAVFPFVLSRKVCCGASPILHSDLKEATLLRITLLHIAQIVMAIAAATC